MNQGIIRNRKKLPYQLSPREIEVLRLIAEGLSDKEIAKRLGISTRTASTHAQNIYQKLKRKTERVTMSRTQAVRLAIQFEIIKGYAKPLPVIIQSSPETLCFVSTSPRYTHTSNTYIF